MGASPRSLHEPAQRHPHPPRAAPRRQRPAGSRRGNPPVLHRPGRQAPRRHLRAQHRRPRTSLWSTTPTSSPSSATRPASTSRSTRRWPTSATSPATGSSPPATARPSWGQAHRILLPAFSQRSMKTYFPQMLEVAQELVTAWHREPGRDINVTDDMTRLTLDTIALSGFDYAFHSFDSRRAAPVPAGHGAGADRGDEPHPPAAVRHRAEEAAERGVPERHQADAGPGRRRDPRTAGERRHRDDRTCSD